MEAAIILIAIIVAIILMARSGGSEWSSSEREYPTRYKKSDQPKVFIQNNVFSDDKEKEVANE